MYRAVEPLIELLAEARVVFVHPEVLVSFVPKFQGVSQSALAAIQTLGPSTVKPGLEIRLRPPDPENTIDLERAPGRPVTGACKLTRFAWTPRSQS